jgi:hypothetical protein
MKFPIYGSIIQIFLKPPTRYAKTRASSYIHGAPQKSSSYFNGYFNGLYVPYNIFVPYQKILDGHWFCCDLMILMATGESTIFQAGQWSGATSCVE